MKKKKNCRTRVTSRTLLKEANLNQGRLLQLSAVTTYCLSLLPTWYNTGLPIQETQETGLDPWVEKIPGEGNGNPVQYSCLGNPTDRGPRWVTVRGIVKRQTQLSH